MKYFSTRNAKITRTPAEAVTEGIAPDGGLYLPEEFRADDTPRGFCEKYEWGKEQYGYIRSLLVNDVEIGNVVFYK